MSGGADHRFADMINSATNPSALRGLRGLVTGPMQPLGKLNTASVIPIPADKLLMCEQLEQVIKHH